MSSPSSAARSKCSGDVYAAARQDRHHHPRQPSGQRVRRHRRAQSKASPAATSPPRGLHPGGQVDRRPGPCLRRRRVAHRAEALAVDGAGFMSSATTRMSKGGPARRRGSARARSWMLGVGGAETEKRHGACAKSSRSLTASASPVAPRWSSLTRAGQPRPCARRDLPEGHGEARYARALRRHAPHGDRTVVITGDNPLTAATIAPEAGVDDFLAEATPSEEQAAVDQADAGGRATGRATGAAPATRRRWRGPTSGWR